MKRSPIILAALVPLALVFEFVFGGVAEADTLYGNDNMCGITSSNGVFCWNVWNGTTGAGRQVRQYAYGTPGEPNNDWNIWNEGTVSAARNWPFSLGVTYPLNSEYNGDRVYKFAWAPAGKGSGWCIDQRSFSSVTLIGPAVLQPCQPTSKFPIYQYFVNTGGNKLIAVWATEVLYNEGTPAQVALSTTALGNGGYLNLTLVGNGYQVWYPITKP